MLIRAHYHTDLECWLRRRCLFVCVPLDVPLVLVVVDFVRVVVLIDTDSELVCRRSSCSL